MSRAIWGNFIRSCFSATCSGSIINLLEFALIKPVHEDKNLARDSRQKRMPSTISYFFIQKGIHHAATFTFVCTEQTTTGASRFYIFYEYFTDLRRKFSTNRILANCQSETFLLIIIKIYIVQLLQIQLKYELMNKEVKYTDQFKPFREFFYIFVIKTDTTKLVYLLYTEFLGF